MELPILCNLSICTKRKQQMEFRYKQFSHYNSFHPMYALCSPTAPCLMQIRNATLISVRQFRTDAHLCRMHLANITTFLYSEQFLRIYGVGSSVPQITQLSCSFKNWIDQGQLGLYIDVLQAARWPHG